MKYLKKSFAVLLIAAVLLGSASGVSKDENVANSGTQGNNSGTQGNNSGNGNTASGSIANQNLKDKYKNLKGRKITVVGWWNATSPSSEEGKLIAEVEQLFNCDMIEKKLTDYKPLYNYIFDAPRFCFFFFPGDTNLINLQKKNLLTALYTI